MLDIYILLQTSTLLEKNTVNLEYNLNLTANPGFAIGNVKQ